MMSFQYIFALPLLLLLCQLSSIYSQTIQVQITQGRLGGLVQTSSGGRDYFSFRGIPYGQVERRFDPSIAAGGWTGVRNATAYGPACAQGGFGFLGDINAPAGSEDCLHANVYTPRINGSALLPVIAFIHGGGFTGGEGSGTPGDLFMDHDVVFVSFNYRLGPLGFLTTGDEVVPGNNALKDQSLALRWVRDNIHFFGGDRDHVLLAGESAGSCSVSHHIISPMSAGLFRAAWASSGVALSPWGTHPNIRSRTVELAEKLNCSTQSSSAIVECLRARNWEDIVTMDMTQWHNEPSIPFTPVVETSLSPNPFLNEDPQVLMETGRFNRVPTVYGLMEDEGIFLHAYNLMRNPSRVQDVNERWNEVAPLMFQYRDRILDENLRNNISQRIRRFYLGDQPLSHSTFQGLIDAYSDSLFTHPGSKTALLHSVYAPVHTFILGYKGSRSLMLYFPGIDRPIGVTHADDIQYMFPSQFPPPFDVPTSTDVEFQEKFMNMIVTYARTGGSVRYELPAWKPLLGQGEAIWNYLDMPADRMIRDPFKYRSEFWEEIYASVEASTSLGTMRALASPLFITIAYIILNL